MATEYLLPARTLKACMVCASTETTRFYLNGVALGQDKQGRPLCVALDGHIGLAIAGGVCKGSDERERLPILPASLVEMVLKGFKATDYRRGAFVHVKLEGGAVTLTGYAPGSDRWELSEDTLRDLADAVGWRRVQAAGTLIDGNFPDWRRVWIAPASIEGVNAMPTVSRLLMEKMCKVSLTLNENVHGIQMTPSGSEGAIAVTFNAQPDALMVAMPMRGDCPREFPWL